MILVRLQRSDGQYLELNLPETPSELTLNQKVEFDFAQMDVISWLKKHEEDLFKNRAGYLLCIAKGLSRTFEIDLSLIMNLKGGNLLEINENDFFEHLDYLQKSVKGINKNQLEESLINIWAFISNVVNRAKENPMPTEIEYKGRVYQMPKVEKHPTTGQLIHKSITFKQAIETIQVNNHYDSWLSDNKEMWQSETHAGMMFTKYLSEIVLLLHVDEIPIDEDEFKIWIAQRMEHFAEIDWQTCYWIESWFDGYIKELRENKENTYFFESTFEARNHKERQAELIAKAKGKQIFKRVGMKSVTAQLMELNPFQKDGMSKIESIMRASFSQIVNLISSHNARS